MINHKLSRLEGKLERLHGLGPVVTHRAAGKKTSADGSTPPVPCCQTTNELFSSSVAKVPLAQVRHRLVPHIPSTDSLSCHGSRSCDTENTRYVSAFVCASACGRADIPACLRKLARSSALNDSQVLDTAGGVIGPWHWQNVRVFGEPPSPRAGHSLSRSFSCTFGVTEGDCAAYKNS